MKVLIVDDNQGIRKSVAGAFRETDAAECIEASNGREGIEKAKATRPNLIILDLSMPEMNGLQAAPILREMFPGTPIILFTIYADKRVESAALEAGISSVVSKTDPVSSLLRKSHELLGTPDA